MTKISRLNKSIERAGMILVGITRREPEGESNAEVNVLAGRCYGIGRGRDPGGPGFGCAVEWIGIDQLGRGNAGRRRAGRNRLRPMALLAHLGLPPIWFLPSVAPPLLVVSLRSGSIASFR
jgi:hypothetical protein